MSNIQLKRSSLDLAKRMREFEAGMLHEVGFWADSMVFHDGVRVQDNDKEKQVYADSVTVYNSTLLGKALIYREELWRRTGATIPDSSMDGFKKLPTHLDHNIDFEDRPIANAADYLEKMARQLR